MRFSTFDTFKKLDVAGASELSPEDVRALQQTLLGILDDVMAVCSKAGVRWSLAGGSALGAVRLRGFIPWDDDLDLLMPREDWPRFRTALAEALGARYAVYEPGTPKSYGLAFPRIRLRGSRVVTREDLLAPDLEPGAFIDVFLIDSTFDSALLRGLHGFGSLLFGFLYSCRKHFFERRLLKAWGLNGFSFRVKRAIGCCLAGLSLGTWTRLWDRWNRQCTDTSSSWVTIPAGRRHFFGEKALRRAVVETQEARFEGRAVRVPADVETYLTHLYGPGYMTPPPATARERHVVFEPLLLSASS